MCGLLRHDCQHCPRFLFRQIVQRDLDAAVIRVAVYLDADARLTVAVHAPAVVIFAPLFSKDLLECLGHGPPPASCVQVAPLLVQGLGICREVVREQSPADVPGDGIHRLSGRDADTEALTGAVPSAFVTTGILLLLLTPVLSVVVVAVFSLILRDKFSALTTLAVLGVLLVSLALALWG